MLQDLQSKQLQYDTMRRRQRTLRPINTTLSRHVSSPRQPVSRRVYHNANTSSAVQWAGERASVVHLEEVVGRPTSDMRLSTTWCRVKLQAAHTQRSPSAPQHYFREKIFRLNRWAVRLTDRRDVRDKR